MYFYLLKKTHFIQCFEESGFLKHLINYNFQVFFNI